MFNRVGDILEDVVFEIGSNDIIMAPQEYDLHHGTDFWYCGVRCDVTFRHHVSKDNTIGLGSVKTDLMPIFVGVRRGNAHGKFSHPVCVISFSGVLLNGACAKEMISTILTEELLDNALDIFWDGCDCRNIDIPNSDPACSSLMRRRA